MEPPQRKLSNDPISFIQAHVRNRQILWTYHVNLRLRSRSVPRQSILDAVDSYQIVEAYPDNKYFPSYLVLAQWSGDAIHVLFATDVDGDNVRVITAYRPNPIDWENDLKTRRRIS